MHRGHDWDDKFGIYQSQLSRAWCLICPERRYQPTEWFNTSQEAYARYRQVTT